MDPASKASGAPAFFLHWQALLSPQKRRPPMCDSCQAGGPPIAALWARVSTRDQVELSPEGQVSRVRPMLESKGYVVPDDKVLKVTWSSWNFCILPKWRSCGAGYARARFTLSGFWTGTGWQPKIC